MMRAQGREEKWKFERDIVGGDVEAEGLVSVQGS